MTCLVSKKPISSTTGFIFSEAKDLAALLTKSLVLSSKVPAPVPLPSASVGLPGWWLGWRWLRFVSDRGTCAILLMEEIRRSPVEVGSLSHDLPGVYTFQVVSQISAITSFFFLYLLVKLPLRKAPYELIFWWFFQAQEPRSNNDWREWFFWVTDWSGKEMISWSADLMFLAFPGWSGWKNYFIRWFCWWVLVGRFSGLRWKYWCFLSDSWSQIWSFGLAFILAKMTLTCEGGGHHTDKKSRWSNQINFWLLLSSIHQPPKYEFLWLLRGTRGIFKGAQSKSEPVSEKKTPFGRPHGKSWFRKNKSRFKLDTQKTKLVFWKESYFPCFFLFRWICFSFLFSGLIT